MRRKSSLYFPSGKTRRKLITQWEKKIFRLSHSPMFLMHINAFIVVVIWFPSFTIKIIVTFIRRISTVIVLYEADSLTMTCIWGIPVIVRFNVLVLVIWKRKSFSCLTLPSENRVGSNFVMTSWNFRFTFRWFAVLIMNQVIPLMMGFGFMLRAGAERMKRSRVNLVDLRKVLDEGNDNNYRLCFYYEESSPFLMVLSL